MKLHPHKSTRVNWGKKRIKVRRRAEGSSTKCSFSFRCIHAIRHTPYLPEVLQKGRGRPGRWAGRREGEMMARRRRRDGGMDGWRGGFTDETNGGRQRNSWGFWWCGFEDDVYIRGREEREMEQLLLIHEWERMTDKSTAKQFNHVPIKITFH